MRSAASCVRWLHVVWKSSRSQALSRLLRRKSYGVQNGVIGIECPTWLGNATTRRRWWETRSVLFKSAKANNSLLDLEAGFGSRWVVQVLVCVPHVVLRRFLNPRELGF